MPDARRSGASRSPLLAVTVGNALEWYDFSVYVLFAPYIAAAFFPGENEAVRLVNALILFGVGFLARPLGALLIGGYADRAGRKAALTLTLGLMAAGTLVIAATPTYAHIGIAAPCLILVGRLLQGLSAGGEMGGASVFLLEHAPEHRRARAASALQASMALSNIFGSLVALAVHETLTPAAIADWGWRIPFLVGLAIVPVGLWLRRSLHETAEFEAMKEARLDAAEMAAELRTQASSLAQGFGISILWGVCVYALVLFMPVYSQTRLGFSADAAFIAALFGNGALILASFASGVIADRIGREKLLRRAAFGLAVLPPFVMAALVSVPIPAMLIAAQICFGALVGLYSGAIPAVLAALFPARIRSLGVSVAYNGAVMFFAGFAPALISAIATTQVGPQAPAVYTTAAALAALAALAMMGREKQCPAA